MECLPVPGIFQVLGTQQRSKRSSPTLKQLGCNWSPSSLHPQADVSADGVETNESIPVGHPTELTYYLHGGQVYPDFLEAGKPSCCVVLPTLAVITSAPVVGTLGWVVQPTFERECFGKDGKGFLGISRHLGSLSLSSPTCTHKPRRNSQSHHGPVSRTLWGGQTASPHRISERQTRSNTWRVAQK